MRATIAEATRTLLATPIPREAQLHLAEVASISLQIARRCRRSHRDRVDVLAEMRPIVVIASTSLDITSTLAMRCRRSRRGRNTRLPRLFPLVRLRLELLEL